MEEQENLQEVEQVAAEATEEAATPEATEPQTEPTPEIEAVDEQGVPYKNRAAEAQRRLEERERELQALKAAAATPPAQPAAPQKNVDPKAVVDEFVKDPDAWYQKRRQQEMYQDRLAQADQMIRDKDPGMFNVNVQNVIATAKEYNIDLQTDPVAGVKSVFKIQESMQKASSQSAPAKKAADKKRVADIKKTQPEGGAKPPAPVVPKTVESLDRLRKRGKPEDVSAYLHDLLD